MGLITSIEALDHVRQTINELMSARINTCISYSVNKGRYDDPFTIVLLVQQMAGTMQTKLLICMLLSLGLSRREPSGEK